MLFRNLKSGNIVAATDETSIELMQRSAIYEAVEIAANAQRLFGYSADIATAALDFNHVTRCSLEKAKKLIKDFAERKVD